MGFRVGAGIVCVVAVAALAAAPAQAAFPGSNGKLAFDGFTVNPDGTDRTPLPLYPGWAPTWSPDGTKLASASIDGVQVSNPDGSEAQTVWDLGTVVEAIDWSPDGQQIVAWDHVVEQGGDSTFIVAFNSNGSFPRTLIEPGTLLASLSWSPRGDRIAFNGLFGGVFGTYSIKPDGTGLQLIAAGAGHADFSPDGSKLVAIRGGDVVVIDLDGGGETQLTTGPSSDREPAWSPDGTKIVFQSDRSPVGLYIVDANGGTPVFVTASQTGADWQPIPVVAPPAKNRAHACKAERQRLGAQEFANRYGGGANAHGKCVSGKA